MNKRYLAFCPYLTVENGILNTISLECNKKIKLNFDGGDLSSDAGLLLIKEFASKIGFIKLINGHFCTNDSACFRYHTDPDNFMQMVYQIISGYYKDDCADELTNDPIMTAILEKNPWHRNRHYPGSGTVWMKILLNNLFPSIQK